VVREIPLDEITIVGALDVERTANGLAPRRLPAWTRPQLPDELTRVMVAMTAGVRLAFTTTSTTIELDALPSAFERPGANERPIAFELLVDGEVVSRAETLAGDKIAFDLNRNRFELVEGEPAQLRFEHLPGGSKRCELWLPHNATIELHAVRIDDDAEFGPPEPTAPPRRRWIHHGSSISHCVEAPTPTTTWPAIVALGADVDLLDLGLGGSCHLDQYVARTIRDEPADFISLKIGVNVINFDSLRERAFRPALHGFLDTVRDGHPDTPIVVASLIVFPIAEDTPGPTVADGLTGWKTVEASREARMGSMTARRCREIIAEVVAQRRELGDDNLHYLDGLELFGPDDVGDLPDGLHPNTRGYARIGERFLALAFGDGGPFSSAA
jgi:GDSL-like Lipase/Acylhydrolase family